MSKNAEWIVSLYTSQLLLFLLFCYFVDAANNSNNTTTPSESLDVILHKHAFRALVHRRPLTGALYEAPLPADLAGIQVTVVRLRSRTLWRNGANFSNFRIPSRTLPTPYVRRLFLVYQDLGNLSSHYYNISGYSLVSSVVGLTVYDASNFSTNNITKLDLSTTGTRISIQFPNLTFEGGNAPRTSCAIFGADGRVSLTETSLGNVCYSRSPGHFSIVAPLKTKDKERELWAIGFVLGFIFLVCAGFVGMIYVKLFKVKKMHEMEKEAHEGVVLDTVWIHNSRMPSATVTRTHPTLENADFP